MAKCLGMGNGKNSPLRAAARTKTGVPRAYPHREMLFFVPK